MLDAMANGQLSLIGTGGLPTGRLWEAWLSQRTTTARFTAKVHHRAPQACWFWIGALGSDGHGRFRVGSRPAATSWVVTAHVFAYQHAHGLCHQRLLTADVVIRHRCDEASCQNPHTCSSAPPRTTPATTAPADTASVARSPTSAAPPDARSRSARPSSPPGSTAPPRPKPRSPQRSSPVTPPPTSRPCSTTSPPDRRRRKRRLGSTTLTNRQDPVSVHLSHHWSAACHGSDQLTQDSRCERDDPTTGRDPAVPQRPRLARQHQLGSTLVQMRQNRVELRPQPSLHIRINGHTP